MQKQLPMQSETEYVKIQNYIRSDKTKFCFCEIFVATLKQVLWLGQSWSALLWEYRMMKNWQHLILKHVYEKVSKTVFNEIDNFIVSKHHRYV